GAQTISNVQFQATNTSAAVLEAIRQATGTARGYAGAIADASALKLGRTLDVSTDVQPYNSVGMADRSDFGMAKSMAAAAPTQVVAPELKVTVTVSGRWEMLTSAR